MGNHGTRQPKTNSLQLIHVAVLGSAELSVNGESKGSKPHSSCQPPYAPLNSYQGRVIAVPERANYSRKW